MMLLIALFACAPPADEAPAAPPLDSGPVTAPLSDTSALVEVCQQAVVTDIDETLTTSDAEWFVQLSDPTYDPAERPDAATLMNGYADRGYRVIYMTARGEEMADGTARQLTTDWLVAHGFPLRGDDDVVLADGIGAIGEAAATYKTERLAALAADGWSFPYGYGNASTDMEAFETVVPLPHLFLVGELAGTTPYQGLSDEQAYSAHLPHLDSVPLACP